MRKSRGLLAAGTVLVFLFASGFLCTLVDTAQEEDPDRSAQPATLIPAGGADSPGTIKAGEEAEGEGGVIIGASDDALDAPLNVWIEPADEPTDATDFPPEAKRETPYFRIGAAENIYARQNGWFRVEIPVSDQANTGHLALVVLEPAGSVIYDGNCESEECDDFTRYDAWLDLEGIYDPETSRFITSLPFLSSEGRIVTVISSEDYESLTPEEHEQRNAARDIGGALLRPANSGLMFIARCRRFIWHAGRSCGDAEKNMATADLSDVFSDLTGIGYKEAELRHVFLYPRHYVVYLRPLVNSTDGDDDPELCEIEDDGDRITGQYSPGTNKMTICIDTDGYSDNETATLRHEYFHATQWAYDGVTNDPDWSGWVIEGTATASEFSLNTMDRDDGRSLHTIDRPLRSDAGFFEYRAQDFWVYLGDRFGEDLGYLEALFERGDKWQAADGALQNDWPESMDLGAAYWEWVKNQVYEKTENIGGDLGTACQLNTNTVTPLLIDYDHFSPPPPQPLNLDPLDSTIVTVTLKALPGQDYVANLSVIMEPEVNVKYYVKDAPNCASQPEGREFSQAVTAGNDQTVYVLVTNTKPEASATPELYFTPREPDVRILQPTGGTTFVEGNAVPFQAQTIGFQDSNVNVDWSYMDGPTQVIVGTSDPNQTIFEDHLCDGTYTFTATAYTGFETATDSVTFSVNNPNGDPPPQCAPSVEIVEPRAGATLQAGVNVTLRADYHDDHPESSTPLYNINWYAIGAGRRFLGSGEVISNQLEEGDSSIQVEYGTASDEISVTVQAPQPDNDPPSAEIRSPDDGANFRFDDEGAGTNGYPVEFTGRGTDPQDGTITDNRLTWYYRQEGTSEWTEFGQGANASHTFRYNSCYSQNFEILLEVVDSDGLSGSSDMITITIVPPYC